MERQTGRKHLQTTFLTKNFYSDYKGILQTQQNKINNPIKQIGENSKQAIYQIEYMNRK